MTTQGHTVEKIGGTSMTRSNELLEPLFLNNGKDPYKRVFVVSAYSGITDLLLEHKKTGEPGVYALFSNADTDRRWTDALDTTARAMKDRHRDILSDADDIRRADGFVDERVSDARSCLLDLQRLCSYGHFRLSEHLSNIREMLSGMGEAHSAFCTSLLLERNGVSSRFVDLTGWRGDGSLDLDGRISLGMKDIDLAKEVPVVTGYAQCVEKLMSAYDRGYSEVTFSRLAVITDAREAIIHKEFHLSSADPKLVGVDAVRKLGRTNYDVADQLSNMGMEAIHPSAAKMLRQAGIPLRVTNAFEPDDPGTLIDDSPAEKPSVEIVTGLDVTAFELFEQDMVGVKGYDSSILDALKRHKVRIVAKSSNANTITHYLDSSLKSIRRVEGDLKELYPSANMTVQSLSIVSLIGRDLAGLKVLTRALAALDEADILPVAVQQTPRSVDVQFVVHRSDADAAIAALHRALIEDDGPRLQSVAA